MIDRSKKSGCRTKPGMPGENNLFFLDAQKENMGSHRVMQNENLLARLVLGISKKLTLCWNEWRRTFGNAEHCDFVPASFVSKQIQKTLKSFRFTFKVAFQHISTILSLQNLAQFLNWHSYQDGVKPNTVTYSSLVPLCCTDFCELC